MPRRQAAKVIEWLVAHADVAGFNFSASFGAGNSVRWRPEPWSETLSVDIEARFIDFDYKGFKDLSVTLYGDRRFDEPGYQKELAERALESAGLLNFNGEKFLAFSFMPIPVFRHACFILACGRPVILELLASPLKRRQSTIRSIRVTTDRSDLE
jgi:hypothetical protein